MKEMFTDQARLVCVRAQSEARALGHGYVGTEHLLLGLLYPDAGLATEVLSSFGLSAAALRQDIETLVTRGGETAAGDRPLTPRAQHAMECAREEARALQQPEIGPEHLLLGLLREPEGVAGKAMRDRGLDIERIRLETVRIRLLQMAAVERIVRPMRAPLERKRKIREELLAHLEAGLEQERQGAASSLVAMRIAAERLGDPSEVCRQIQRSLPVHERLFYWVERWFSRRGVESYGRWFVRGIIHANLLVAPLFGIALIVNASRLGWNDNIWPLLRFMLVLFFAMPATLFVMGLIHFKLRDAYWGAFGTRRSRAGVFAYGTLLFFVLAVSLNGFVVVSGLEPWRTPGAVSYVAAQLMALLGPLLSYAVARQVGEQEIGDVHWASLNLAELEPLLAKQERGAAHGQIAGGYEGPYNSAMTLKTVLALSLMGAAGLLGGCVERKITVGSDPSGAILYLNDQEIGRTPISVPFTWYGIYDIRLRLERNEGTAEEPKIVRYYLHTHKEAKIPPFEIVPMDLFAEILPIPFKDEQVWAFPIPRVETIPDKELIDRAQELKEQMGPVRQK